ncbi:hypothetical protein Micbo1qcDRAFT_193650 [Microdochium bolleyi]|uniref:AMP-activated protein kinase glycogen-binding domain-containing protein n=1 Tax=Microdochium bolleyi TaxID=196109 RepID=A0A136JBR9_9PEZI|nr:hypothetical protein Micbo1qcDRAFT_193650 [Microdochium bolleyi]
MLELAGATPVNLSKPGTPTPSSELLTRPHRPPSGHELVDHCQKHASGTAMATRQAMANFTYQKPGTQPPVYIAGTFSDPPWQPHEMEAAQNDDGEYLFTKSWPVEGGVDVQYKFRIGSGDWWVLNDDEDVVDDGHGNFNNTLSVTRFSIAQKSNDEDKPLPSRLGALRGPGTPSRTLTPDFVRTTIEVSDSAALLHDEVPSREIPRHVPAPVVDLHAQMHTPVEETAGTAAEVADTAAKLDQGESFEGDGDVNNDNQRDDPPLLAHECMNTGDGHDEQTGRTVDIPSPPQNLPPSPWDELDLVGSEVDLDNPRLEKFPSERSAIYAAVRRLSTSVEQDDVSDTLAIPRSPGFRPDERTLEGGFATSPPNIEATADGSSFLKASDANQSPDRDTGLRPVSSLQSIPEGEDDDRDTARKNVSKKQVSSSSKPQSADGGSHAEDEGIAMSLPSRERTPRYTWEQKPRGRSGSLTDHGDMMATDDVGPSKVAVNHTQIEAPHVLVHGPDLVNDGDDTASSGDDVVARTNESESHKPKSPASAPRPGCFVANYEPQVRTYLGRT